MKKIVACAIACYMPLAFSGTEIVVPDLELGHWVTTVDTSAMVEEALAAVPESSRAMVKKMMEQQMQSSSTSNQCITQETLDSFDEQIKDSFGAQNNCEFNVIESSSEKFVATMQCPESVLRVETNIISSKRNESTLVSDVAGMGQTTITSVSKWVSSDCPAGL